jgi:hypothetical protein
VFASPVDRLDPSLCAALGFRVAGSAEIVAHLEALRRRWDAAGREPMDPVRVRRASSAIYAALGDPARELSGELLAALAVRACIWDPARACFWIPAHAFAAPVADLFGELRGHVPGESDEVRRGLARLGRRESADANDIVAALHSIREARGELPLADGELALVLRLLRRLQDLEPLAEAQARLLVPTRAGQLCLAAEVRVDDAPWFSARVPAGALAFVHPGVGRELVDRLGLARLSTVTREALAERPALSGDLDRQAFCSQLMTTIHDPAFAAGVARIVAHQGVPLGGGLELLAGLRIVATDRLVTELRIAGVPAPLGAEEVPVFTDEQQSVVYVRADPWDSLVVQISEAINRLLHGALHNLAHLEAILRTSPGDIVALLDQRRVLRLHDDAVRERPALTPEPAASTVAPPRGGAAPSVLTHERSAGVEAEGASVAADPGVVAAALAAVIASERSAGRDARRTDRQVAAYDLQVGEPGDPTPASSASSASTGPGIASRWSSAPGTTTRRRAFGRNFWLYVVEHALEPGGPRSTDPRSGQPGRALCLRSPLAGPERAQHRRRSTATSAGRTGVPAASAA